VRQGDDRRGEYDHRSGGWSQFVHRHHLLLMIEVLRDLVVG
jgi:hypothetical protein